MTRHSPRTPYEIRLELLQLSFDILRTKHQALGVQNGNNITTSPSTEEVIAEAEKMNMFVSKAGQH
jgi:hypothetical protein